MDLIPTTSYHDLFFDSPIIHVEYELNGPPIYDSYEMKEEDLKPDLMGNYNQVSAPMLTEESSLLFGKATSAIVHESLDLDMLGVNLISPVAPQYELYGVKAFVEEAYFKPRVCNGPGLLDYYIEDDQIKDVKSLNFSSKPAIRQGSKVPDLRSNLQQPGVNDAGASSSFKRFPYPQMISNLNGIKGLKHGINSS